MRRVRTMVCIVTVALVLAATLGPNGASASRREELGAKAERTVGIYAAVVRQLVTIDHTFGGGDPGFSAIYVIDGPVEGAADPLQLIDEIRPEHPFKPKVIQALRAALEDLPEVAFVDDRATVVTGPSPGRVIDNGVLVTLGAIGRGPRRVEVEANLWINGLAGQWLTYVVERDAGTWEVTGTTGPVSIS